MPLMGTASGKNRNNNRTSLKGVNLKLLVGSKHPYAVLPFGNFFLSNKRDIRSGGLGYFSTFSDEFLLDFMENYLDPIQVVRLAQTSKAFYVFTSQDALWRSFVIKTFGGKFQFSKSWKFTFVNEYLRQVGQKSAIPEIPIQCPGLFSDHLFATFYYSSIVLNEAPWVKNAPETIPRVSNPTLETFATDYLIPNKPVILTDVMNGNWAAMEKWAQKDYLMNEFGNRIFRAEAVDIEFKNYAEYAQQANEEAPLYLFDKHFATDTSLGADYAVPNVVEEDFFKLLGNERPDYRWLIVGPLRSGSSWHVDPNSTSAWNAVISGSKKWILIPPEATPPGVFPAADGSEVTAPQSLMEWFVNYYHVLKSDKSIPYVEGICRKGEILFVPNGWWHCVLNVPDESDEMLEESEPSLNIAITQNFVNRYNLVNVLKFLKHKPDQISGLSQSMSCQDIDAARNTFFDRFVAKMEENYPDVIANALKELDAIEKEEGLGKYASAKRMRAAESTSLWDQLVLQTNVDKKCEGRSSSGLFSFGFGGNNFSESEEESVVPPPPQSTQPGTGFRFGFLDQHSKEE